MKTAHFVTSVLAILLSFQFLNSQPSFQWVDKLNCNDAVNTVGAIKSDKSGNVYVLSMWRGTIVFPNEVLTVNIPTDQGRYGAVLAKYNSQGILLWGKQLCTIDGVYGMDMDIDSSGNMYVGISGNVYVDSSQMTTPILLAKYDNSGNRLWQNTAINGNFSITSLAIKLNASRTGLLMVFGVTSPYSIDLGNGIVITLNQIPSVIMGHYDISTGTATSGTLIAAYAQQCNEMAVAQDSSVFVSYVKTTYPYAKIFMKLDYYDDTIWTKRPVATNLANISGIATDGKDCFVIGNFMGGSIQLDGLVATTNYTSDFFITKVGTDGTAVFLKTGCAGPSGTASGERIVFDKNRSFYILGSSNGSSPVGSPTPFVMQSPNEHFILRYDTSGNAIWMTQFNTNLYTSILVTDRATMTVSDSLAVFVSGLYKSTAHFGSDSLINNFSSRDAFVFKVGQCNISQPKITADGATSICQGQTVTLTCPSAPGYSWSNGQTSEAITVSATGNYAVTVSNTLGCLVSSIPLSVTVNPTPAMPVINAAGNVLASSSVNDNQWLLHGNPIVGATNQLYTVPSSLLDTTCYSVEVKTDSGCSAMSDSICFFPSDTTTGMYAVGMARLRIYPNPSNGDFIVSFETKASSETQLIITDMIGNIVHAENFSDAVDKVTYPVRTNSLAVGMYLLTIQINGEVYNGKIVLN